MYPNRLVYIVCVANLFSWKILSNRVALMDWLMCWTETTGYRLYFHLSSALLSLSSLSNHVWYWSSKKLLDDQYRWNSPPTWRHFIFFSSPSHNLVISLITLFWITKSSPPSMILKPKKNCPVGLTLAA